MVFALDLLDLAVIVISGTGCLDLLDLDFFEVVLFEFFCLFFLDLFFFLFLFLDFFELVLARTSDSVCLDLRVLRKRTAREIARIMIIMMSGYK